VQVAKEAPVAPLISRTQTRTIGHECLLCSISASKDDRAGIIGLSCVNVQGKRARPLVSRLTIPKQSEVHVRLTESFLHQRESPRLVSLFGFSNVGHLSVSTSSQMKLRSSSLQAMRDCSTIKPGRHNSGESNRLTSQNSCSWSGFLDSSGLENTSCMPPLCRSGRTRPSPSITFHAHTRSPDHTSGIGCALRLCASFPSA
jgi:hypothetical protein